MLPLRDPFLKTPASVISGDLNANTIKLRCDFNIYCPYETSGDIPPTKHLEFEDIVPTVRLAGHLYISIPEALPSLHQYLPNV
jgi:hypothetical protein